MRHTAHEAGDTRTGLGEGSMLEPRSTERRDRALFSGRSQMILTDEDFRTGRDQIFLLDDSDTKSRILLHMPHAIGADEAIAQRSASSN